MAFNKVQPSSVYPKICVILIIGVIFVGPIIILSCQRNNQKNYQDNYQDGGILTITNWPYNDSWLNIRVSIQTDTVYSSDSEDSLLRIGTRQNIAHAYLNSPFTLRTNDGKIWNDNGTYNISISSADGKIKMTKEDVYFSNGSATIDYNDMKKIERRGRLTDKEKQELLNRLHK